MDEDNRSMITAYIVFWREWRNSVTFNLYKSTFCTSAMFLGHIILSEGINPISTHIEAIQNSHTPTNITEFQQFLGMAQQLAKFSPHLVEASEPLWDLLSPKNYWVWTEQHSKSFNNFKEILSTSPVLKCYDVHKPNKTYGSKLNGISVILLRKGDDLWKPVAYSSRYLIQTKKN